MKRLLLFIALTFASLVPHPVVAACQSNAVIMWVSPGCVWCEAARHAFLRHGVYWQERDVRGTNFYYTPTFWIDGVYIIGYNREQLAANLCLSPLDF